jgi:hypothetical protein
MMGEHRARPPHRRLGWGALGAPNKGQGIIHHLPAGTKQ